MKRILFLLAAFFIGTICFAQSSYYMRYDTVVIVRVGGNGELTIMNAGRDSQKGGVLYNTGGGRTAFKKTVAMNDSTLIIGGDTVVILGGVKGGSALDTTSLSARIDAKVNISDTLLMLYPFLRKNDTASLSNRIDERVKYSDTASMLAVYLLKSDTASLSIRIDERMKYSDTASLSNRIDGKQPVGNYITGLNGDVAATGPGLANAVLAATSVIPGTYKLATVGVDQKGRTVLAANGVVEQINDSTFRINEDTITIRGTGGGGDSATFSTNYRRDTAVANLRDEIAGKQDAGDYITDLTGDVTASGPGSAAATIANNAVTTAKINNGAVTMAKLNTTGTPDGTKFLRDDGAWENPPGGGGQTLYSDLGPLSETKIYTPAAGVASSSNVANYSHTSVDSARYKFSTTRAGTAGSEYGGWLFSGTSGDSIRVTAPFWIVIGDSQAEGHPGLHGRLHTLPSGAFQWDYPDSVGQLSYHFRQLTNMRWYNHGVGGQTTAQVRARFFRDVLAQASPGVSPSQTLTRLPQGVVIIAGINDVFNGIDPQTTKENLEWMASVCQQYGIRCVILNLPGDEISGQTHLKKIADINLWLASGVMDQYGACVVDYNSWWNDPAYGNDNVHPTSLIVDDIHPSKVGYDSLANYIYRKAKLPKLTKILFINELDPGGFIGYSRPAAITIDGNPYTITNSTELIDITTYVPDSVWVKVNTSNNVTGTTYSGFEHMEWYVDNNPNDSAYYTKRTLYSGSTQARQNISALKIIDPVSRSVIATQPIVDVRLNDTTLRVFQVYTSGGGGTIIVNGLTNTTAINNGTFNVYGIIGASGNILGNGTSNKLGNVQIMSNSTAGTTGYGISGGNTLSGMDYQSTPAGGKHSHLFSYWNGATTTILGAAANSVTNSIHVPIGFANAGNDGQTANVLSLTPTYNQTSGSFTGTTFRGIYYRPIRTSLTNTKHVGMYIASGNNYINVGGTDSTCFGCDSAANINAKFRVNGSMRFDIGSDADYDFHYRAATTGLQTRLAIGTANQRLKVNSTATGYEWVTTSLNGTTTHDFGTIANNSSATTTISVTGAADGDFVVVTKPIANGWSNGESYTAWVSGPDTVSVRQNNNSGGSAGFGSQTINVKVIKQ